MDHVIQISFSILLLSWLIGCTDGRGPTSNRSSAIYISVSPNKALVSELGERQDFEAQIYDKNDNLLSGIAVTWSSTDTSVATVDTVGLATGRDTGAAYIKATADGVTDSARLVVDTSGSSGSLSEVAVPSESEWSDASPIITPGDAGSWDERLAGPAPATAIKKDGTLYLYYVGAAGDRSSDGGPANRAVGLATSTDGSTWEKHSSNPVIPWSDLNNNGDEEEGAWGMAAYVHGNEILLYVSVLKGSGGSVNGDIHLFTSTDGVTFTDQGVVIDHADSSFPGNDEVTPTGVYRDNNGRWHLYYLAKGGDVADWSLAHASGTGRASFSSGTVIREQDHRMSGDAVVLKNDSSGQKLGLMVSVTGPDVHMLSFTDEDFGAGTLETTYSWGTQETALYLDRSTSTWYAFHGNGSDDVDAIDLRTAVVKEH